MEVPVCELYRKNWHSVDVLAMRFIPSLRLEGQAGESAAIWVIFFTFQEQLSSINVKKNHCSAPLVGTLSRVVATHAFFSLWCLNSKCSTCQMEYKVMLNIPNASVTVKNGVMRMMSGIIVLLFSKKALHWRVEHVCAGGGGTPYLVYTGQLWAAEHKVLGIKQGAEFYYWASWTVSFGAESPKKNVKACDEQFTFAVPITFFQSI